MKLTLRLLLSLLLLVLGFYIGICYMLVPGLIQIMEQIKLVVDHQPYDVTVIAWGLVKCCFCGIPMIIGCWTSILNWVLALDQI